jgi:hypothetical protein
MWAPFHWNDEHGEYLAVNAVTNNAVDPVALQPEFKVCAVRLRPISAQPSTAAHPTTEPTSGIGWTRLTRPRCPGYATPSSASVIARRATSAATRNPSMRG